jgi:SNF2 family DNA or RNA helicase
LAAHRIGQLQQRSFHSQNTVEEKIIRLQQKLLSDALPDENHISL